jgi:predicted DNA-binding transcriptional regulator YafY
MSKTARLFQLMQLLRLGTPPLTAQVLAKDLDDVVEKLVVLSIYPDLLT